MRGSSFSFVVALTWILHRSPDSNGRIHQERTTMFIIGHVYIAMPLHCDQKAIEEMTDEHRM
jgi:hypothetical protein